MNTMTNSIGINKWAAGMSIEVTGSTGEGDNKVTAWKRSDGKFGLETNGDPVFGVAAEEWVSENLTEAAGTMYGFSRANSGEEAAWFHTLEAAERFNAACGGILGDVETTDSARPADVMDTPETPWTAAL